MKFTNIRWRWSKNAAAVRALIDNRIERVLDPKVCRRFIIDGAKARSKVIRHTGFTDAAPAPMQ